MPPSWELFHEVSDGESARVRRFVVEQHLQPQVRFRNAFYLEVRRDLEARGGRGVPALWDGETLIQGAPAVLARLRALVP